ncbi:MAG: MGMT family protein [Methylocella sp.]
MRRPRGADRRRGLGSRRWQALARNPFAIIVPCHRVVAAGGRIGGFSANGGVMTKSRLLAPPSPFVLVGEVPKASQGPVALAGAIATGRGVLAARAMSADFALPVPAS